MSDKETRRRPNPLPHLWAVLVDTGFILLFALIGRASHDERTGLADVLATAWPFLVGMLLAAVLVFLLRWRPTRPVPAGALVWVLTLVIGMGLRAMTGEGTATPFVLVATGVLLLFLLGWRLLPTLVTRMSRRGDAKAVGTGREQRHRAGNAPQPLRDVDDRVDPKRFRDAGEIDRDRFRD